MSDDDIAPWDDDYAATRPVKGMGILDQLQLYQHMVRRICPFLDAYETTVLTQIVDRITGWQKREAVFRADALYAGDKMYGGIARAMDRSRMMKALRTLELRGVITRRRQRYSKVRIYCVNFDVDLSALEATARPVSLSVERSRRREDLVSPEDLVVSNPDLLGSREDHDVSGEGTREGYRENRIENEVSENTTHPAPSAPGARSRQSASSGTTGVRAAQARLERSDIQPRPRTRRRAD